MNRNYNSYKAIVFIIWSGFVSLLTLVNTRTINRKDTTMSISIITLGTDMQYENILSLLSDSIYSFVCQVYQQWYTLELGFDGQTYLLTSIQGIPGLARPHQ